MNDLIIQWHSLFFDVDRVPVIIGAIVPCLIVGMIIGPLLGNANPLFYRFVDTVFGRLGERMDKKKRLAADLMFRGFFLTVLVLVLSVFVGKLFAVAALIYPAFSLIEVILLSLFMTAGSVWFALLRLYFAMDQDKMGRGAYYAIARSTRRNLSIADNFGITRTAMTYSARSFDKGLVAPALWYIIGGFPFVALYSALAALSWRFGKDGFNTGFAAVPMALERLMGFIPSMLSGLLITVAANFTPTAKIHKAVIAWLGAKDRAPYEQGGLPLSALAWGLNVSLGGAAQDISGSAIKGQWVGPKGASAKLNHKHLRRAIYINVIAHILFVAALLGMYMWSGIL